MKKKLSKKKELLGGTAALAIILAAGVFFMIHRNKPSSHQASTVQPKQEQQPGTQGDILNVHSISLSATSGPTSPNLISTCQTIASASCSLRVVGATTFTIKPTSSDGNGQFSFEWNAKTIGLTAGDWTVQLEASDNGQTATSDTETLHVSN